MTASMWWRPTTPAWRKPCRLWRIPSRALGAHESDLVFRFAPASMWAGDYVKLKDLRWVMAQHFAERGMDATAKILCESEGAAGLCKGCRAPHVPLIAQKCSDFAGIQPDAARSGITSAWVAGARSGEGLADAVSVAALRKSLARESRESGSTYAAAIGLAVVLSVASALLFAFVSHAIYSYRRKKRRQADPAAA